MTKIKNRYKIFHRYESDFWGFLVFNRKKSKINKLIYLSQIDQFKRIDIRFLEILSKAPRGKRSFYRTLISKANNMTFFLKRYFVGLSQRQIKLIVLRSKKTETSNKRNLSYLLESRVDAILLRTNLFFSIRTIKQWINHGFILVNLERVWTANQHVNIGDVVSFSKDKKILLYNNFFKIYFKKKKMDKNFKSANSFFEWRRSVDKSWIKKRIPLYRPHYLEQNYKLFFFSLWKAPAMQEINFLKKFKNFFITGPSKNRMRSSK